MKIARYVTPVRRIFPFSLSVLVTSSVVAPFFVIFGPNEITYYGLFFFYTACLFIWFFHGDPIEDFLAISTMFISIYILLPQPALWANRFYFWGAPSEFNEPSARILLICALFLSSAAAASSYRPHSFNAYEPMPPVKLRKAPLLGIAAALVTFALLFPGILFSTRSEVTQALGASRPLESLVLVLAPRGIAIGYCMVLLLSIGSSITRRERVSTFEVALLFPGLIYFYPLAASRQLILTAVLAMLFILSRLRLFDRRWAIGLLPFVSLVLAPAISNLTRYEERIDTFPFAPDFDVHQNAALALQLVDEEGIRWGAHLLASLSTVLPSELKFFDSSHLLASERLKALYGQTNISLPIFIEFFIDFSWVGVLILTYLVFRLIRNIQYVACFTQRRTSTWFVGASCIILGNWLTLNRGPFLGNAPVLIIFLLGWTICQLIGLKNTAAAPKLKC